MKRLAMQATMLAMALGLAGVVQAAETNAFAVTLVVPRGERYVEPAEGVFVISRRPVVFHIRVMNTAGETKAVQGDESVACALELTDAKGVTTLVTRRQKADGETATADVKDLVNGNTFTVAMDLDGGEWDGVPDFAGVGQKMFDVRAIYRSLNGKATYSKSYTVLMRL